MTIKMRWLILSLFICAVAPAAEPSSEADQYWPQWRGPLATGVAPHGNPPIQWSEDRNVRWKIAIPGQGFATPIVWADKVYVVSAVETDEELRGDISGTENAKHLFNYEIMALSRKDGRIIWRRTARTEAPHEKRHAEGSWASASPVTDGECVIASFGSRGLFCYDMDGNLQWEKDLGDMRVRKGFGEGSSPVLYGDRLIVPWDHEDQSFIVALDKRTGNEIWRVNYDDESSWSTPLVIEHDGKTQVVNNARDRVRSFDLESGKILWETGGLKPPVPTPITSDGVVYVTAGFREYVLQAISLTKARGDAKESNAVLWEYNEDTSYVSTPLIYGNILYFYKSTKNIISSLDKKTGKPFYVRQRVEGIQDVYASPVASQGRIYLTGRKGGFVVIKHGPKFEILAQNRLNDRFDASPAIAGNEMYLRGHKYLYCIASE
jgi:outer membrane protein assembly factor BamB